MSHGPDRSVVFEVFTQWDAAFGVGFLGLAWLLQPANSVRTHSCRFLVTLDVEATRFVGAMCMLTTALGCGGIAEPVGAQGDGEQESEGSQGTVEPDSEGIQGTVEQDPEGSQGAVEQDSEGSPGEGDKQYATFEDACAVKEGGTFRADSLENFLETVTGVWILCTPTSAFSQEPTEVGLEIADDGTWYHLYGDSPSTMERGLGFLKEGTYDVLDTSDFNGPGSYQLNLNISGSGGIGTHPQFTENASWMALDNNGVHRGEYRKSMGEPVAATSMQSSEETVPEGSVEPGSDGSQDQGDEQYTTFEDACALKEGGTFRADSIENLLETMTGVWILCTPTSAFSQEPTEVGLEIADDGTWYHLYGDSPSTMERGVGFLKEGTYDVLDTSDFNGPGWYQLNLNISGGGGIITFPQFTETASWMAMDNNGVHRGEYRKL